MRHNGHPENHPNTNLCWLLVILISVVPLLVRQIFFPEYPGPDDAFIHLAVINSIAKFNTWGINPGENINLSTSPLFTVIFSILCF